LGGRKGIQPVKTEGWGAGVVICLERDADLRMAQLMPLPLTVAYFSKIQIGFTFLVLAYPGSPGQRAVKRVCVCDCLNKRNFSFWQNVVSDESGWMSSYMLTYNKFLVLSVRLIAAGSDNLLCC